MLNNKYNKLHLKTYSLSYIVIVLVLKIFFSPTFITAHSILSSLNQINEHLTKLEEQRINYSISKKNYQSKSITHQNYAQFNGNQRYIQKSVTSFDITLISENVSRDHFYKNESNINQQFHNQLKLERFNYIKMPSTILTQFKSKISQISTVDSDQIQTILNTQLLPLLKSAINSTENINLRQKQLTKHQQKVTFAEIKGKSSALTQDQLDIILNTSYIFVPFLTHSHTRVNPPTKVGSKKSITTLSGGVLWYHIDYANSKVNEIIVTQTVEAETKYEIDLIKHLSDKTYAKRVIKNAIYSSEKDALQILLDELKLQTRQLAAFKLTDQIIGANKNRYNIRIGKEEDIKLDDTFYIYEWILSKNNQNKAQQVGFGYITKVGNTKINNNYSTLTQQLGQNQSIGGWVEEDPRYKLSINFAPFYHSNLSIKKNDFILDTVSGKTFHLLDKNYDKAFGLQLGFSYNIAQQTQISQLFIDLVTTGSFLSYSNDINDSKLTNMRETHVETLPLLYSGYLGIKKKFWHRNHGLILRTLIGIDGLYLLTSHTDLSDVTISTLGIAIQSGYEKLISPLTSLFVMIEKKWTLSSGTFDYEYKFNQETVSKSLKDSSLGGLKISTGVEFHF